MMTKKTQSIIESKCDGWEYKLTAELLTAQIEPIRRNFDELRNGVFVSARQQLDHSEFLAFFSARICELKEMLLKPEYILQDELMAAWGPRGTPGNPQAIERAVSHFADCCLSLYCWERAVRNVVPPADCETIRQNIQGWAEHLFRQVDATILKLVPYLNDPPSSGRFVFNMDFKPPANVNTVKEQLDALGRQFERQRKSPDTLEGQHQTVIIKEASLSAALLGGLIGYWLGKPGKR